MLHKFGPLSSWGSLGWKILKSKGSGHVNSSNCQTIIHRSWMSNNGSNSLFFLFRATLAHGNLQDLVRIIMLVTVVHQKQLYATAQEQHSKIWPPTATATTLETKRELLQLQFLPQINLSCEIQFSFIYSQKEMDAKQLWDDVITAEEKRTKI